jgi:hypothetical protein
VRLTVLLLHVPLPSGHFGKKGFFIHVDNQSPVKRQKRSFSARLDLNQRPPPIATKIGTREFRHSSCEIIGCGCALRTKLPKQETARGLRAEEEPAEACNGAKTNGPSAMILMCKYTMSNSTANRTLHGNFANR